MKYIIIENNIVKQIQLDDNYNLSDTEIMLEVADTEQVVCGQVYDSTTKTFTNPVIVRTKEELIAEIDQKTSAKILQDLGATNKLDAVIKQINLLYEAEIKSGNATPEMLKVAQIVTKERELGALEKKKLTI